MKTIYVVGGASGEYGDRREWFICYYTNEAKARAHVESASARYREIRAEIGDDPECGMCWSGPQDYCEKHKHIKNEFDPQMQADSSGVNYYAFPLDPWPTPTPSEKQAALSCRIPCAGLKCNCKEVLAAALRSCEAESEGRRKVLFEKSEEVAREWKRAECAEAHLSLSAAVVEAAQSVVSPHCDLAHEMGRLRKAISRLTPAPSAAPEFRTEVAPPKESTRGPKEGNPACLPSASESAPSAAPEPKECVACKHSKDSHPCGDECQHEWPGDTQTFCACKRYVAPTPQASIPDCVSVPICTVCSQLGGGHADGCRADYSDKPTPTPQAEKPRCNPAGTNDSGHCGENVPGPFPQAEKPQREGA